MRRSILLLAVAVLALAAAPAMAQMASGSITGEVRMAEDNTPLPGVTVTVDSASLQGTRTAITGSTGNYIFRLLPPGEYEVAFTLPGMQTVQTLVRVQTGQTVQVDGELTAALTEEIRVTGSYETISSGSASATTYESELMEELPVGRDMNSAVLLTPGADNSAPRGAITIAGASSAENLFMINGVVVNENIRGQAFNLFIEDAIEETTTMTSGVSAEYGRFTGGVVNMLTKSGGNEFGGSFRANLTNEDWQSETPLTTGQEDDINQVYEATFGGYLMQDHLWFFLAGRDREITGSSQFENPSNTPFTQTQAETRYEFKLTASPHVSHRIVGSYIEIEFDETNNEFWPALEPNALDPSRSLPQELMAFNYTGVLTENLFVEAQYSEREMAFVDSGGVASPGDRLNGTTIIEYPSFFLGGSYLFCGQCEAEERNNENLLAKGSYFLTTDTLGSHEFVAGYDTFTDIRLANNYQSPSNFVIWNYSEYFGIPLDDQFAGDTFYPVFFGENGYWGEDLDYWPIFVTSRGTDLTTNSLFLNDTWRVNENFTLTLGARYDENDGVDAAGNQVADDSRISPRLGAAWDIQGSGEWTVNASYGRYVAALANGVADSAGGGNPSYFGYSYLGPSINLDCAVPGDPTSCSPTQEYTTPEALEILFNWFDSVGGLSNTGLWYGSPSISGLNLIVEGLDSPYTDEYMIGLTKRLGQRGLIRADYVRREYGDFYASKTDLETGQINAAVQLTEDVTVEQDFDLSRYVNENDLLERTYDGLHTQFSYRISDRFAVGGNWTWSHTRGNYFGVTSGSGPVASGILSYPEYNEPIMDRLYPSGDLDVDRRHKAGIYGVFDLIESPRHNLSLSFLQNFWSGTPYSAVANVDVPSTFTNPGYIAPPTRLSYYFSEMGAYEWDDVTRTDLSLNYSFFLPIAGQDIEFFLQPEVINAFNEDAVIGGNTTITVAGGFDPYTMSTEFVPRAEYLDLQDRGELVPGQWTLGPDFGQATSDASFQAPRTFRVSLGVRF